MTTVYLALGSNLGNREEYLRAGIRGLTARGVDIVRCASVYSTEPREVQDQPWFLNTAVEANTQLFAHELLRACLEVEEESHRKRNIAKGPRTLDIDIIFYGTQIIRKPGGDRTSRASRVVRGSGAPASFRLSQTARQ
jgi:2-amino-4-hydroxy-6-hydroxymethyldihydropteridine diphosphokinase